MGNRQHTRRLGRGTWIAAGSPVVTEIVAQMGFDWLLFDLEHGNMTEAELQNNIRAVCNPVKVIVRVGECRPALIGRILDWGAAGIMMPHVSCAEEARSVVRAMRYPPTGDRGFSGSSRSFGYGAKAPEDLLSLEQPFFLAQIENYDGVMHADEIARTPGVDILFVGPRDLGLDLSVRPSDRALVFDEALQRVADAASRNDIQAGILVRDNRDLPKLQRLGYTALAMGSDLGALRSGYKQMLQTFK